MARMTHEQLMAAMMERMGAEPDPSGEADLVSEKGKIVVAADQAGLKEAFTRVKAIDGYRWVAINRSDLFVANTLSLGSKAGIVDETGRVLKAPDIPREPS